MRQALFGRTGGSTGNWFPWGGRMYCDDDTSPQAFKNLDIYDPGNVLRLASGGIINRRTLAWLSEGSHKEAVVPLSPGGLAKAGLGGSGVTMNPTITININNPSGGEDTIRQIETYMREEFANMLNLASFEHERRRLA